MTRHPVLLAWFLALAFVETPPAAALARCGTERWDVKTGTDPDARAVDLGHLYRTRIAAMRSWAAPNHLPSHSRIATYETRVWVVDAILTLYKVEDDPITGDSDYHLVLSDGSGNTIIAEIPLPACVGPGSPFAQEIAQARAKFDARFTAKGNPQTANIPVRVTGVGFFDFHHGQLGVAPNGVQLHPVLDIVFNP